MKPLVVDVRPPDEAAIRRMWVGIEARLDARKPRVRGRRWSLRDGRVRVLVPMVAGVAAIVAVVLVRPVGERRVADSTTVAANGARPEVLASDRQQVVVALHEGRARFVVARDRRWVIEAGLARVVVIDTAFEMARYREVVTIVVERGELLVEDRELRGGSRRLMAGESIKLGGAVGDAAARPPPDVPLIERPTAPAPPPRRTAAKQAPAMEAGMSVEEMLAEADRLRRAGQLAETARVLARVAEVPEDPLAGIAWFTRARVLLELGRESEAATDLGHAIEAGLPPALEQRARLRLEELTP